jgi:DNA-directed RNA polymerase subunit K/omega
MNESIFSREISTGLQDLKNRYKACLSIFHRARSINARYHEEEDTSNPTKQALSDFTTGRIVIFEEESSE